MKQENYIKGMVMIILSALFFACMNVSVRLAGDLPSFQKSFFRNLVATFFAAVILFQKHIVPKVQKDCWVPMFVAVQVVPLEFCVTIMQLITCWWQMRLSLINCHHFSCHNLFFFTSERKNQTNPGSVCYACICRLSVCSETGISECSHGSGIDRCPGRPGAGLAYTMVRALGNKGVPGPVIVFCFSLFSCLLLLPVLLFDYTPMTMKQLLTLLMAGLFAAGGQFTVTAAYTCAPAGKISIFDYSQIIFATLLGFFLFGEIPDKYSFVGYVLIILASLGMFIYNMKVSGKAKQTNK